jgi:hypothetical protein
MSKEEKAAKPERAAAKPVKKVSAAKPMRRAAMPMKEMPKEPSPRTVKGKIAAIQTAAGMIYSGARTIQAEFPKQMKENQEFVALMQTDVKRKTKAIQEAAAKVQSGVRAIQAAIGEQAKENLEALAALQSGIAEQMEENQAYMKEFYG